MRCKVREDRRQAVTRSSALMLRQSPPWHERSPPRGFIWPTRAQRREVPDANHAEISSSCLLRPAWWNRLWLVNNDPTDEFKSPPASFWEIWPGTINLLSLTAAQKERIRNAESLAWLSRRSETGAPDLEISAAWRYTACNQPRRTENVVISGHCPVEQKPAPCTRCSIGSPPPNR